METERTTDAETTEEYLNPDQSGAETPTSSDVGKQTLTKADIREGAEPGEFKTTPELDESLSQADISVSSPEEGDNSGVSTSEAEEATLGLDPEV